jgi:DNA-binding LacI/PurR family transcriptional regulator
MDVWHYPPGKRYLNHDRDYWPTLPGQSFEIFDEKLEDQLAREAMEASPLNYEHDNKENMSNAGVELLSDDYDGIYVVPSTQYRQSSDERQLAHHRALVSDALYSDETPQSYGLDETYGTREVQTNALTEHMDILASGGHLPPGQTQVETQTETQDSVLDTDLIVEITGVEPQAP